MGPTCVLSAPDGSQVGPMNLAIRAVYLLYILTQVTHICLTKQGRHWLYHWFIDSSVLTPYNSFYQTLQHVLNQNPIIFICETHWKILYASILSDPNVSHTHSWTYLSFNVLSMLDLWWLNDTTAGNLSQMNFVAYMMYHTCVCTWCICTIYR